MAKWPFEVVGRTLVDGGICLLFKCAECGDHCSLVIRDKDPLRERYPLSCMCGAEVNLFFGSPRVGRALLKALKKDTETPHRCHSVLLN